MDEFRGHRIADGTERQKRKATDQRRLSPKAFQRRQTVLESLPNIQSFLL